MTVRGADNLIRKLSQLPSRLTRPIEVALLVSVNEMRSSATVKIQRNSGSGRTYKRGKRVHIASAPGEFPNTDYGELVRKMNARLTGFLTARWWNTAKHALPLEMGTSRMAARPFIRPTFRAFIGKAKKRVGDAVKAALRG